MGTKSATRGASSDNEREKGAQVVIMSAKRKGAQVVTMSAKRGVSGDKERQRARRAANVTTKSV